MDLGRIELSDTQRAFHRKVRQFLDTHMTAEVHDEERRTGSGFNEGLHLAMGEQGLIMPQWPEQLGGAGLDAVETRILELEIRRYHVPDTTLGTTRMVWPVVEGHLDAELVAELRPQVAAGHVRFCLGYTEPDGGSDVAAAKVRASPLGDGWCINGAKVFITGAQNCQYVFLITRTSSELPKHRGITMFLVPMSERGIDVQAIRTYGGERTNALYFDNVHVPDRFRVGDVNAGWAVLRGPLDAEHGVGVNDGLQDASKGAMYLDALAEILSVGVEWARTTTRYDGSRPADDPVVQACLGELLIELEAGQCTPGPMGRVIGSEALVRGAAALLDLIGPSALLARGAEGALSEGVLESMHRYAQGTGTYGGTTEVFRNMVAVHVLGLPQMSLPGRYAFLGSKSVGVPG